MSFANLIGHSSQLASLRAALSSGRLHHAYLFVGPEGVGKRTIARAMAQAIHCPEADGDFCGRCVNCASIGDGNHADVRFIGLLPDKKEISIQQVRELERELRFRSFGGKRKIAIVDPVNLMNVAAQNALLKTLEEPPTDSLIILIAPNAGALLPTLRSRCLRLAFEPLPRTEVAAFLRTKHGLKDDDAKFLAALSMGSIGLATSLDRERLIEKRKSWSSKLVALEPGDYQAVIAVAEALAASRDDAMEFLRWTESWYRDLLIYGFTDRPDELVNLDMLTQIEHLSSECGPVRALAALGAISAAAAGIQRNLNRRMVLEKFLFSVIEGR